MAFVNEQLTQEERDWFTKRNILNPLDYINKSKLVPSYWTIDREKEAYLFKVGIQRDWPDEVVFFYQLRETYMFISLKKKNALENTVVYSLENTCYSPFEEIQNSEILEELKECLKLALEHFKTRGTPDDWNMSTKVICEF